MALEFCELLHIEKNVKAFQKSNSSNEIDQQILICLTCDKVLFFILEILQEIILDFFDFMGSCFVAVLMLKYFLLKSLVFLEELFDSSLFVLDLLFKTFDERLLSLSKAF
jgi:hypothetical protein